MTSLRLAVIPFDHILAEIAAYPFATEDALRLSPIFLDATLENNTQLLWRGAENYLLSHFPGFSVDEIVSIRDHVWFSKSADQLKNSSLKVHLHNYLRSIANEWLEVHGSVAVPKIIGDKVSASGFDGKGSLFARRSWRWLSLALPPDLILAALGNAQQGPETIHLLSPELDRTLRDLGYAETHLHLGAALEFPTFWVGLLYQLANPQLKEDSFKSPGAKFDEGKNFARWLVCSALIRYALTAFLVYRQPNEDFRSFLFTKIRETIIQDGGIVNFALFLKLVSALQTGKPIMELPLASLVDLYACLTQVRTKKLPKNFEEIFELDPISSIISYRTQCRATPEMTFVATALDYLSETTIGNNADSLFAKLFWQVQRIRVLFYQYITHRPMVAGLQWFIRFFGRLKEARKPFKSKILLESAAKICGLQAGLRSLEVRLGFPSSNSEALQQVLDLAECTNRINNNCSFRQIPLEVGVIYHFNKNRGKETFEGSPKANWIGSESDPSPSTNPTGFRFARYYMQKRVETLCLEWLIYNFPKTLELIRGIDLCSDELGVPNWVFLPLVKHIKRVANLSADVFYRHTGQNLPTFRTTVHSGEDFVHLLTGLRNIDQTVENFALREGDRIGHGIALGINVEDWAKRSGRIAIACEERLLDLVWEWTWYSSGRGISSKSREKVIEYEIIKLSQIIFNQTISSYSLSLLFSNLHSFTKLKQVGFPSNNPPLNLQANDDLLENNELLLLYRYLSDPEIFRRGREIIWVDPSVEAEALVSIQTELRRKISSRSITVEINPTSNLLIGDMGDLNSHPLWRLYPPNRDSSLFPISICVGSDDPMIFASNLRQEYQWLNDALKSVGLSNEEVYNWLNRVRACGLESRFTLPFKPLTIDSIRQSRDFRGELFRDI